jgi:hypothetical protein
MMLSARALLARTPEPSRLEIQAALSGNLCRCTGYTQILQAVETAIAESLGAAGPRAAWQVGPVPPGQGGPPGPCVPPAPCGEEVVDGRP